jgi:translation initiation factor 2 gamma subunit (eIF-2gamma)
MSVQDKAQDALSRRGFPTVKFIGREEYKGREQLLFTMPNGDPVMDAPILLVDGDDVEVRPWFDRLQ